MNDDVNNATHGDVECDTCNASVPDWFARRLGPPPAFYGAMQGFMGVRMPNAAPSYVSCFVCLRRAETYPARGETKAHFELALSRHRIKQALSAYHGDTLYLRPGEREVCATWHNTHATCELRRKNADGLGTWFCDECRTYYGLPEPTPAGTPVSFDLGQDQRQARAAEATRRFKQTHDWWFRLETDMDGVVVGPEFTPAKPTDTSCRLCWAKSYVGLPDLRPVAWAVRRRRVEPQYGPPTPPTPVYACGPFLGRRATNDYAELAVLCDECKRDLEANP